MSRNLIKITLLAALAGFVWTAKAETVSLNRLAAERLKMENEMEQRRTRLLDRELADSLFAAISIDSLTAQVYRNSLKTTLAPKIYGAYYPTSYVPRFVRELNGFTTELGTINAAESDTCASVEYPAQLPAILQNPIPEWLKIAIRSGRLDRRLEYTYMASNPYGIDYAAWELPEPPVLPEEDYSFHGYLKRLKLPEINTAEVTLPEIIQKRRNWLHTFNVALQFSQAYVSSNWYQGGNDYLSFLFNLGWDVELNTVYYPNVLFQSSFQYKLAFNTTPKGSLHKFSTSQDLLQYNLKTGFKAFKNWFYSFNLLFNTQLFNYYPEDSNKRTSAFLSPGTLNIGIGLTYNYVNPAETFNISASISPLAYNLKTCLFNDIDHAQFNIKPGHKTVSEIGSSGEINMMWKFNNNISWKSRLFLFTDYKYFLADWENTFNFQISKVLSTQLFVHPRFDSSTEWNAKWKHFMLREILSFGISYTFTNKVS